MGHCAHHPRPVPEPDHRHGDEKDPKHRTLVVHRPQLRATSHCTRTHHRTAYGQNSPKRKMITEKKAHRKKKTEFHFSPARAGDPGGSELARRGRDQKKTWPARPTQTRHDSLRGGLGVPARRLRGPPVRGGRRQATQPRLHRAAQGGALLLARRLRRRRPGRARRRRLCQARRRRAYRCAALRAPPPPLGCCCCCCCCSCCRDCGVHPPGSHLVLPPPLCSSAVCSCSSFGTCWPGITMKGGSAARYARATRTKGAHPKAV